MYLQENISITHLSNYKTPATARYFYEISNIDQIEELKQVFTYIQENHLKHLIIG